MQYKATIGADFLTKQLVRKNSSINLQIWDTVGSEKYHSIGSAFYRNCETCILVFDLTNADSFKNVETWRKEFLSSLNPPEGDKYPFVLFGNKSDMEGDIKITDDEIRTYCLEHNDMPYFKVSAKNGTGVEEGFDKVCDLAFSRVEQKEDVILPDIKPIKVQQLPEKKSGCPC
jgi:Ras-related protein Rab-7A